MHFNAYLAFLSLSAPGCIAVPLVNGLLGSVSGVTGTHVSGDGLLGKDGLLSTTGDAVGSITPAEVPNSGVAGRGLVGSLTGTVGSVTGAVTTVATGTVSSVVGPAALQGICDLNTFKCTITVSGDIENLLTDGNNFTGNTTISAWMKDGHAYGSAVLAGSTPSPFNIQCDAKDNVCVGTVTGNITQVLTNGNQVALWGWATPSGRCRNGTCTGSITACGDPGYKMKRDDLC